MPPKAKKRQTAEGRENIRQRIASEKRDLLDKNTKLQLKYAQASLRLPPYRPGPAPNAPEIKSNFFKITLLKDPKTNAPGPTLQKYKIILGDVNGFELTNRKTRKYLIEELLQKNPPTHGSRISDYFNYIISVRKIYEKYDDDPKEAFETPHLRTGPGGSVIGVTSRVQFDGYVNKDELLKMVNNQRTPNYQPDADLMALNVVSWLRVRSKEFSGGLIGKKFYPEKTELSKPIGFRTRKGVDWKPENRFPYGKPLYELKSGFFSSVWLGTKNLLLNVNVTTSAFYANVSVQDWIITRCSEDNDKANCKISDDEAAGELVGLKVTLKGDTEPKREYRILEVYKATVSTCTVEKEDGTQPSVYDDLIADACCVDVGTDYEPNYFPADQLEIAKWQVVRDKAKLDRYAKEMIDVEKRNPCENQKAITTHALDPLGVRLAVVPNSDPRKLKLENVHFWTECGLNVQADFVTLPS